jgi:predicted metal-dependent hydrolase
MSVQALLEDLRARDVSLKIDGLTLRVDAPTGVITEEERKTLQENKRTLIRHLERERLKLEKADRRGLVIKWAREPGCIALHDPTTGEWHEVKASECPPSIVESAKAHNRRARERA